MSEKMNEEVELSIARSKIRERIAKSSDENVTRELTELLKELEEL